MSSTELPVRTDAENKHSAIGDAADKVLAAHGWVRTGDWDTVEFGAIAPVERA